jgi:hypothetical protein
MEADPGTTTLYLTSEELSLTSTGTVTGTRSYGLGGATVAALTAGSGLSYLVGDQQGTEDVAINASTLAASDLEHGEHVDPAQGDRAVDVEKSQASGMLKGRLTRRVGVVRVLGSFGQGGATRRHQRVPGMPDDSGGDLDQCGSAASSDAAAAGRALARLQDQARQRLPLSGRARRRRSGTCQRSGRWSSPGPGRPRGAELRLSRDG